jgi:superkiller protein 3
MTSRNGLTILALFLSLSGLLAQDANPLQAGVELLRHGRFSDAIRQFQAAERVKPRDAVLENLMGITESRLGLLDDANRYYIRSIELDPTQPGPHKNLGVNYLAMKQFDAADKELSEALRLKASDKFVHYYLCMLNLAMGRDAEAIEQSRLSQSLIASDAETSIALAGAFLRTNQEPEAARIIDSLKQTPGLTTDQEYKLATEVAAKQMYPQAVELFRRIAAEQPTWWISKYNLAIALLDAGQQTEALQLLESLAIQRPADGNVFSLLGSTYESAGKLPAALDAYEKAVANDPGNSDRYLDYTRVLMDLDRYDDAVELIQKGIKNASDSYALNIRLGAVEMMKAEYEKARQCFEKAIEEHPDVAIGYVALAKALMKQANDMAAADVLATARAKVGRDFGLEYISGLVFSELGRTEQAVEALKSAAKLNPSIVEPHYQLGRIYLESGNLAGAQTELEQVIRLAPSHAPAHYQLSKVYARLGDKQKSREMQEYASQLMQVQRESALSIQKERLASLRPE